MSRQRGELKEVAGTALPSHYEHQSVRDQVQSQIMWPQQASPEDVELPPEVDFRSMIQKQEERKEEVDRPRNPDETMQGFVLSGQSGNPEQPCDPDPEELIEVSGGKFEVVKKVLKIVLAVILVVSLILTAVLVPIFVTSYQGYKNSILLYKDQFNHYIREYNLTIPSNEFMERLGYFSDSELLIQELNEMNLTWTAGHTGLSHLSESEFNDMLNFQPDDSIQQATDQQLIKELKDKYNVTIDDIQDNARMLRKEQDDEDEYEDEDVLDENNGRMLASRDYTYKTGPVRNQGRCGSCSMFAAADLVGAQAYDRYGSYRKYSTQQLVDCTYNRYSTGWWWWRRYYNKGCNGGNFYYNLVYAARQGLASQQSYPYTASRSSCKRHGGQIPQRYYFCRRGTYYLNIYTRYRPATISFAVSNYFRYYRRGIYDQPRSIRTCTGRWWWRRCRYYKRCDRMSTNHAMLAVQNGNGYMKVKNSWGWWWGESGYVRIKKWVCQLGSYNCF